MIDPRIPRRGMRFPWYALAALLSAIATVASFPSPLAARGFGFIAWIALVPVLACLAEGGFLAAATMGALYGTVFVVGSQYWLASYAAPALAFAALLSALQFAVLFPLVSMAMRKLRYSGPAAAAAIWTLFEYLRSHGSLAFPFGEIGLSQFDSPFIVRFAALGGVFFVSFLVVLSNAILALALHGRLFRKSAGERRVTDEALWRILPSAMAMVVLLIAGTWYQADSVARLRGASAETHGSGSLRIALVQHGHGKQRNARDYLAAIEDLEALSREALPQRPDLVIWPESAVVPSINWHVARREDRTLYEIVREVDAFAAALPCPLLFGNDVAESRAGADPGRRRTDRNAAILRHGDSTQSYAKTRLVPFAEEVPSFLADTRIGKYALELASGGWARGNGPLPLSLAAAEGGGAGSRTLSFGTPICFEDGFGDYCLGFARLGASFLAVLTSDAWSHSAACEYQHLAQSVFRSAETGLPVVRAASTGITALILPDGRIARELPPFEKGVLTVDLPLAGTAPTLYARIGDGATLFAGIAALLALCRALVRGLRRSDRAGRGGGRVDTGAPGRRNASH